MSYLEQASRVVRARRRARNQGLTLVEIMVVIVIIGLIAGAAGFAVLARLESAKKRTTYTNAQSIKQAAETWKMENSSGDCPTVEQLVEDGIINSGRNRDGWDRDFEISCDGIQISVASSGPDGERGTDDDITDQTPP